MDPDEADEQPPRPDDEQQRGDGGRLDPTDADVDGRPLRDPVPIDRRPRPPELVGRAPIAGDVIFGTGEHEGTVEDVDRAPVPGAPPVPGAQWDEVHRRWERWEEASDGWVVVGDAGDGVDPADEWRAAERSRLLQRPLEPVSVDLPPLAGDDDGPGVQPDVERWPEPPVPVEGAQWNEVVGRWERWDEAAGAWTAVEAPEG